MAAEPPRWPELPYKGLGYYAAADRPLFAGRDEDVYRCAGLLAEWRTRLLLLHGPTACGKSSFLRAGLIPHLDEAGAGIAFARAADKEDAPVLFIRSTAEPLATLADAVYRFATREVVLRTPGGEQRLALREALPGRGEAGASSFRHALGEDPAGLLEVLEKLSVIVPETLVLIIDQGEEVLTIDQSADGERRRELFFSFLSEFTHAQFDLKLVIALRTEYFGRFVSRARRGLRGTGIAEYYLDELSEAQVVEAVTRPTSTAEVAGIGSPRSAYRFDFEPGVVEAILSDLRRTGGRLPALQIVCTTLYDTARARDEPWRITMADLDALGGVEGSIERFLDRRLFVCGSDLGLPPVLAQQEVAVWKEALNGLARPQPDGTVTTELKQEALVCAELKGSRLDFDRTVAILASDDVRLLRVVNVVDARTGVLVRCLGLGHDTLGLVLRNWKVRHDRERELSHFGEAADVEGDDAVRGPNDTALCLSGGGYRAMLYHLGALWRLNELGWLPRLARVSGVSAGALLGGLLGLKWKRLEFDANGAALNFVAEVVAPVRHLASITIDIQSAVSVILSGLGGSGAQKLSRRLEDLLYGKATLQDLPEEPAFVFTAVNLQSASPFRMSRHFLGNHAVGRMRRPRIALAAAVAASAAMPPVLSPMVLEFDEKDWDEPGPLGAADERYLTSVMLSDGSLQDHLGIEAVWRLHRSLLVSDASGRTENTPDVSTNWMSQVTHVVGLQAAQLSSLRRRQILDALRTGEKQGAYWSIVAPPAEPHSAGALTLGPERVAELLQVPVRFARMADPLQEQLINWGYASCDATLRRQRGVPDQPARYPYASRPLL
jgi:NTE family protein